MADTRVFLDSGGSAPVTGRASAALQAGLADGWADPVRLHTEARRARALLDGAREAVAEVLGARPDHTWFTPSLDVAFTRAVAGITAARRGRDRIVTVETDRDALIDAAQWAAAGGVDAVQVDQLGRADLDQWGQALADPAVIMAALHHANRETGTAQDVDVAADDAARFSVPLLVDATATIGHLDAPGHWDALVADPADWGAPAGLGVVAMRPHTRWLPAWPGEDWAPTGISVPLALAAAVALQEREEQRAQHSARLHALVARLRDTAATMEGVIVVGDGERRAPHLLTLAFLYLDGEPLVSALDRHGFSVGSGSACGSDNAQPSKVLATMGLLTHGNVRLGLHPGIAEADIERFVTVLPQVIEDVRRSM